MADQRKNPLEELQEWNLRSQILATLAELDRSPIVGAKIDAHGLLEGYAYSDEEEGRTFEPQILVLLDRVDRMLFYKISTAQVERLKGIVSSAVDAINARRARREELSELPKTVIVEIPSELIENLRAEADEMELNTLGVIPEPVAAVLAVLEAAAKDQTVAALKHSAELRRGLILDEDLPNFERNQDQARAADFGDEEEMPVLEGMVVYSRSGASTGSEFDSLIPEGYLWKVHSVGEKIVEIDGITNPGIGINVEIQDFWKSFNFASDMVQPGAVIAAIRKLASDERADRTAQIRAEISSTISSGANKVADGVTRLNERYRPLGEQLVRKAVSAVRGEQLNPTEAAEVASKNPADGEVLDEAFSADAFGNTDEQEADLQALRERLRSTPKPAYSSTGSRESWSRPRDQLAQLIYDAQHPDNGSKWLTTVDGSPNVVSYEAADALLSEFPRILASSDGPTDPAPEEGAQGSDESDEPVGPKLEDFPVPVPPAESDLGRLRYLQRSLSLDDFEESFRRDDTLAELLELLPNAIAEISYLRDNEGKIQQGFLDTLDRLKTSIDTSSVRQAWVAYERAVESRDAIYESRQEERAKVRQLEAEIQRLEAVVGEGANEDLPSGGERVADLIEEVQRGDNSEINRASVISYNPGARSQRELGHVSSFMVSGIPMAVKISEQEGTTLKLLELIPQGSEKALFRKEICATGFLTEEKLRRIVMDSDGWLGNDDVEVVSQSDSSSADGESSEAEAAAEEGER